MRREPKQAASVDWASPVNWRHPLNRNLVRWWKAIAGAIGGQTLHDLASRDDATLAGGVGFAVTRWVGDVLPGGLGTPIRFTGSDALSVDSTGVNVSTFDFTMVFRVILRTATVNTYMIGGDSGCAGVLFSNASKVQLARPGVANGADANTTLATGVPYTVQVTFDSVLTSSNVFYYLNGQPDGIGSFNQDFSAATKCIGTRLGSGFNQWSGEIDDVRIYLDRKLNADEAMALHLETISGCPQTLNRVRRRVIAGSANNAVSGLLLKRRKMAAAA